MKPFLYLCCLMCVAHPALAQDKPLLSSRMMQWLDSAAVPGIALAILEHDTGVRALGFGAREAQSAYLVDEHTVFSAASLSKPVLGYIALVLLDEGLLELDKPLYQYLPYPDAAHDARYQHITARMVLSHTSGFPNWRRGKLNLLFTPKQRFSYSGEGFVYLQKVIEHISQTPIETLAQEKVFKLLHMTRSSFVWQASFEDNYSYGHDRFGFPTGAQQYEQANCAYSLLTTASDYGKFLLALVEGRGLKPETHKQLFEVQVRTGKSFRDTSQLSTSIGWGMGLGLQQTAGDTACWHWGDNGDFKSFFFVSLTQKKGLVYFSNAYNGLSLARVITESVVDVPLPCLETFLSYTEYEEPILQLGRQIVALGIEEALKPYRQNGNSPFAEDELQELSNSLERSGRTAEAMALLDYSTRLYPDSPDLLKAYGLLYLRNADQIKALAVLQRYQEIHPDDKQVQHLLDQLMHPAKGNVQIRLDGFSDAKMITIAGSFNEWQALHTLLYKEADSWVCQLNLLPGRYTYKFVVDGKWITDPGNPLTEKDGQGNLNSVLTVER